MKVINNLKELYWILLPRQEIKKILLVLRELGNNFDDNICWRRVLVTVSNDISLNPKYFVDLINNSSIPSRQICLHQIVQRISYDLTSGKEHVDKGTLGMRGEAKRQILHRALNMLVIDKAMTFAQRKEIASEIDLKISEAG